MFLSTAGITDQGEVVHHPKLLYMTSVVGVCISIQLIFLISSNVTMFSQRFVDYEHYIHKAVNVPTLQLNPINNSLNANMIRDLLKTA